MAAVNRFLYYTNVCNFLIFYSILIRFVHGLISSTKGLAFQVTLLLTFLSLQNVHVYAICRDS